MTQYISPALPHRYPFLLIDKVIKITVGEKATTIKNVSHNEPFFQGHFPENPIMPGVLLIEAMAQTCALIYEKKETELFVLAGVKDAVFRLPVYPGDQIYITAQLLKKKFNLAQFEASMTVNQKNVASANISGYIVEITPKS